MDFVVEFVNILGVPEVGHTQQYVGLGYEYCSCETIVGTLLDPIRVFAHCKYVHMKDNATEAAKAIKYCLDGSLNENMSTMSY